MRLLVTLLSLLLSQSALTADPESDEAAAALADARFEQAAELYSAIVRQHPDDGEAHYRLGIALMNIDRLDQAAAQFKTAGEAGYQPLGVAYRLARIRARQGNVASALEHLEKMAAGGFKAPKLVSEEQDFASLRGNDRFEAVLKILQENRFPCRNNPKNRQLDFWVGKWDVTSLSQPAGTNDVRLILGGCVVFENWESAAGTSGKSFNFYDAAEDHWRQIWVDDTGGVIEFAGGLEDGVMVYTAETHDPKSGATTMHKMSFTPNSDGSVRQLWEQSRDGGKSWTIAFDGHYAPNTN